MTSYMESLQYDTNCKPPQVSYTFIYAMGCISCLICLGLMKQTTDKAPPRKEAARCSCCQLLPISRQKYPSAIFSTHLNARRGRSQTESRYNMSLWNHASESIKNPPFILRQETEWQIRAKLVSRYLAVCKRKASWEYEASLY